MSFRQEKIYQYKEQLTLHYANIRMRDYPEGYRFSSIKVFWILWMSFALRQGYWIIARPYQNTHYKYSGGGKFPSLCGDKTKPWRCFRPKEPYKVILFLFVFGGKNWYAGIVLETNRKDRKWRKTGFTNWVFIERVKNKINCSKRKLISGGMKKEWGVGASIPVQIGG